MSVNYSVPEWSAPPKYECSLDVVKDGIEIQSIDLSTRAFFIVGECYN
jgi:hypothetical protein